MKIEHAGILRMPAAGSQASTRPGLNRGVHGFWLWRAESGVEAKPDQNARREQSALMVQNFHPGRSLRRGGCHIRPARRDYARRRYAGQVVHAVERGSGDELIV